MLRSFFHLFAGLAGLALAAVYVPIAALIAVVAMPLAAVADAVTSWLILLLRLDDPLLAYPAGRSTEFPPPQTGSPELSAFA